MILALMTPRLFNSSVNQMNNPQHDQTEKSGVNPPNGQEITTANNCEDEENELEEVQEGEYEAGRRDRRTADNASVAVLSSSHSCSDQASVRSVHTVAYGQSSQLSSYTNIQGVERQARARSIHHSSFNPAIKFPVLEKDLQRPWDAWDFENGRANLHYFRKVIAGRDTTVDAFLLCDVKPPWEQIADLPTSADVRKNREKPDADQNALDIAKELFTLTLLSWWTSPWRRTVASTEQELKQLEEENQRALNEIADLEHEEKKKTIRYFSTHLTQRDVHLWRAFIEELIVFQDNGSVGTVPKIPTCTRVARDCTIKNQSVMDYTANPAFQAMAQFATQNFKELLLADPSLETEIDAYYYRLSQVHPESDPSTPEEREQLVENKWQSAHVIHNLRRKCVASGRPRMKILRDDVCTNDNTYRGKPWIVWKEKTTVIDTFKELLSHQFERLPPRFKRRTDGSWIGGDWQKQQWEMDQWMMHARMWQMQHMQAMYGAVPSHYFNHWSTPITAPSKTLEAPVRDRDGFIVPQPSRTPRSQSVGSRQPPPFSRDSSSGIAISSPNAPALHNSTISGKKGRASPPGSAPIVLHQPPSSNPNSSAEEAVSSPTASLLPNTSTPSGKAEGRPQKDRSSSIGVTRLSPSSTPASFSEKGNPPVPTAPPSLITSTPSEKQPRSSPPGSSPIRSAPFPAQAISTPATLLSSTNSGKKSRAFTPASSSTQALSSPNRATLLPNTSIPSDDQSRAAPPGSSSIGVHRPPPSSTAAYFSEDDNPSASPALPLCNSSTLSGKESRASSTGSTSIVLRSSISSTTVSYSTVATSSPTPATLQPNTSTPARKAEAPPSQSTSMGVPGANPFSDPAASSVDITSHSPSTTPPSSINSTPSGIQSKTSSLSSSSASPDLLDISNSFPLTSSSAPVNPADHPTAPSEVQSRPSSPSSPVDFFTSSPVLWGMVYSNDVDGSSTTPAGVQKFGKSPPLHPFDASPPTQPSTPSQPTMNGTDCHKPSMQKPMDTGPADPMPSLFSNSFNLVNQDRWMPPQDEPSVHVIGEAALRRAHQPSQPPSPTADDSFISRDSHTMDDGAAAANGVTHSSPDSSPTGVADRSASSIHPSIPSVGSSSNRTSPAFAESTRPNAIDPNAELKKKGEFGLTEDGTISPTMGRSPTGRERQLSSSSPAPLPNTTPPSTTPPQPMKQQPQPNHRPAHPPFDPPSSPASSLTPPQLESGKANSLTPVQAEMKGRTSKHPSPMQVPVDDGPADLQLDPGINDAIKTVPREYEDSSDDEETEDLDAETKENAENIPAQDGSFSPAMPTPPSRMRQLSPSSPASPPSSTPPNASTPHFEDTAKISEQHQPMEIPAPLPFNSPSPPSLTPPQLKMKGNATSPTTLQPEMKNPAQDGSISPGASPAPSSRMKELSSSSPTPPLSTTPPQPTNAMKTPSPASSLTPPQRKKRGKANSFTPPQYNLRGQTSKRRNPVWIPVDDISATEYYHSLLNTVSPRERSDPAVIERLFKLTNEFMDSSRAMVDEDGKKANGSKELQNSDRAPSSSPSGSSFTSEDRAVGRPGPLASPALPSTVIPLEKKKDKEKNCKESVIDDVEATTGADSSSTSSPISRVHSNGGSTARESETYSPPDRTSTVTDAHFAPPAPQTRTTVITRIRRDGITSDTPSQPLGVTHPSPLHSESVSGVEESRTMSSTSSLSLPVDPSRTDPKHLTGNDHGLEGFSTSSITWTDPPLTAETTESESGDDSSLNSSSPSGVAEPTSPCLDLSRPYIDFLKKGVHPASTSSHLIIRIPEKHKGKESDDPAIKDLIERIKIHFFHTVPSYLCRCTREQLSEWDKQPTPGLRSGSPIPRDGRTVIEEEFIHYYHNDDFPFCFNCVGRIPTTHYPGLHSLGNRGLPSRFRFSDFYPAGSLVVESRTKYRKRTATKEEEASSPSINGTAGTQSTLVQKKKGSSNHSPMTTPAIDGPFGGAAVEGSAEEKEEGEGSAPINGSEDRSTDLSVVQVAGSSPASSRSSPPDIELLGELKKTEQTGANPVRTLSNPSSGGRINKINWGNVPASSASIHSSSNSPGASQPQPMQSTSMPGVPKKKTTDGVAGSNGAYPSHHSSIPISTQDSGLAREKSIPTVIQPQLRLPSSIPASTAVISATNLSSSHLASGGEVKRPSDIQPLAASVQETPSLDKPLSTAAGMAIAGPMWTQPLHQRRSIIVSPSQDTTDFTDPIGAMNSNTGVYDGSNERALGSPSLPTSPLIDSSRVNYPWMAAVSPITATQGASISAMTPVNSRKRRSSERPAQVAKRSKKDQSNGLAVPPQRQAPVPSDVPFMSLPWDCQLDDASINRASCLIGHFFYDYVEECDRNWLRKRTRDRCTNQPVTRPRRGVHARVAAAFRQYRDTLTDDEKALVDHFLLP